jgi:hypothetical protein
MNEIGRWFASAAVSTLVALVAWTSIAAATVPLERDEVYRDARLGGRATMTVAILPAVTTVESVPLERFVEQAWATLYRGGRTTWMPADDVRTRLAEVCADHHALEAAVHARIWRDGEVDAATARELAAMLGVDAVLCVRLDRFEIVDGCRAVVGMSAAVIGGDGTRWWSIRGCAGRGVIKSSRDQHFNSDLSWVRDPRLEPCTVAACLGLATYDLFARWAWSLPTPMYEDAAPRPVLTVHDGR